MKNTFLNFFLAATLFAGSQTINSQDITVNTAESNIRWMGKKIVGNSHKGNISLKSGIINMTDGTVSGGNFVVDMTSMTCTDLSGSSAGKLVGHLTSDHFFGVKTHPEASLTFTSIEAKGDGIYTITGDFTIKGKTNPAQFDLKIKDGMAMAKVIIDRTKYGIRYGSNSFIDNLGNKAIDNNFELDVTLKL